MMGNKCYRGRGEGRGGKIAWFSESWACPLPGKGRGTMLLLTICELLSRQLSMWISIFTAASTSYLELQASNEPFLLCCKREWVIHCNTHSLIVLWAPPTQSSISCPRLRLMVLPGNSNSSRVCTGEGRKMEGRKDVDSNSVWELIKPQTSRCPTPLNTLMNLIRLILWSISKFQPAIICRPLL